MKRLGALLLLLLWSVSISDAAFMHEHVLHKGPDGTGGIEHASFADVLDLASPHYHSVPDETITAHDQSSSHIDIQFWSNVYLGAVAFRWSATAQPNGPFNA